jgi:hypothetical protein
VFPALNTDFRFWDFENNKTDKIQDWKKMLKVESVAVALLGNTIGNLKDCSRAFKNIVESCNAGDNILIGYSTYDPSVNPCNYLKSYKTELFQRVVIEPFVMWGIDPGKISLDIYFEERSVVGDLKICEDVWDKSGKILLPKGEAVRCLQSKRFIPEEIYELVIDNKCKIITENYNRELCRSAILLEVL